MIAVRIPKEIKEYKEKLFLGLTVRQLIATVLSLGICIPLYIFGIKYINEELVSWLIMFIALPCVGFGFFKRNGMFFEQYIKVILKFYFLLPVKRPYKTDNFFESMQNIALFEDKKNVKRISESQRYKNEINKTYEVQKSINAYIEESKQG